MAHSVEIQIDAPEIGSAARAMSFGAKPKLQFIWRWCAVLMALASMAAALPVAALSFGCYGAAMLLGRVRPLREAYEFLSRGYNRILERLGQKVLRDPRDTPALRVMVSLSLTAVPIFAIQLVLGKPRLLLVIAFYLALYGLKFQRFVRMFSASHVEAHRRHGYFSGKYDKVFGRYLEFFLGYLYGNAPELGLLTTVNPSKIVELFKLGEGNPPTLGIKTADVVDGFYSFLGFPRLVESAAIKRGIARGIQDGLFGYYFGATPMFGNDGKYQVPLARVRFNAVVGEDEIDTDSGFLMLPQGVPSPAHPPATAGAVPTSEPGASGTDPTLILTPPAQVSSGATPSDASAAQNSVEINFSADRNQLFTAWNAIANLADLAGKVDVTVRADSTEGFEPGKLQNGVLEPLRESNLIK